MKIVILAILTIMALFIGMALFENWESTRLGPVIYGGVSNER